MYHCLRPGSLLCLWLTWDFLSLNGKEGHFLRLLMICKLGPKYGNVFALWPAESPPFIPLLKTLNILSHVLEYSKLYCRQSLKALLKRRSHSVIPAIFLKLNSFLKAHSSLSTMKWQMKARFSPITNFGFLPCVIFLHLRTSSRVWILSAITWQSAVYLYFGNIDLAL